MNTQPNQYDTVTPTKQLISELYKTQQPRLIAVLTRIFGVENLNLVEDTVQETFQKALVSWTRDGTPPSPAAWLSKTAKNQAIDIIRARKTRKLLSSDLAFHLESEWSMSATVDIEFSEEHIKDDQLKMMFLCCDNELSPASQLPLILRLLCGLSINAIARALLTNEETIKKRLHRAKSELKQSQFELPSDQNKLAALDTVHTALYLVFNEGFHSSENTQVVDISLCKEAIGLVGLLIDAPIIANRESLSLFALMHFHIARVATRTDASGHARPLDLQDRSKWDQDHIKTAKNVLALAKAFNSEPAGRFYFEALIAKQHCEALSFGATNWAIIIDAYDKLFEVSGSPLALLNGAIALAYSGQIEQAIERIDALQSHKALKKSHLPSASLAHCYAMKGDRKKALSFAACAEKKGGTIAEHKLMYAQLDRALKVS